MTSKCLYCYQPISEAQDLHPKCSVKIFGTKEPPVLDFSLDKINELAKEVVDQSIAVPGVQPKLSMSLTNEMIEGRKERLTIVGALGGQYIFKPPSDNYPEMPANEHLTMQMAEAFGIRVVPSSLVRLSSGELSYITKRVDRNESGEKIHMIDMFQITEAFDKYKSSMEKVGKALGKYSSNPLLDKIFYFELVLFSFLTGNNDMHLKNFSMLESISGWSLAPAYDLLNVSIILPEDSEELALPLEGKKRKIRREDIESFGEKMGLTYKQMNAAFKRMFKNKPKAFELIDRSFLTPNKIFDYKDLLKSRYDRLTY